MWQIAVHIVLTADIEQDQFSLTVNEGDRELLHTLEWPSVLIDRSKNQKSGQILRYRCLSRPTILNI